MEGVTISMRSKEDDPDYRFLPEIDLPTFMIPSERVTSIHKLMKKSPFERKMEMKEKMGLSIADIDTVFMYSE